MDVPIRGNEEQLASLQSVFSVSEPGRNWAYRVETDVANRIVATILGGYGVVLEGSPGAGRTRIAQMILGGLANTAHVVQISSTALISRFYDAKPGEQGSQGFIHTLREDLIRDSGGLPVVIYVSGNQVLTKEVASNLGMLVMMGGISLLAVSSVRSSLNDVDLGRTVNLVRVRIPPLTAAQAAAMLREALGGELSHHAILQLWEGAAHQRWLLECLCLDWVESGYLRKSQGLWIVAGERGPVGDRTVETWQRLLEKLDPDQVGAIEIVALARCLPLEVLLKMAPAAAVDEIHGLGFLESVNERVPMVQLKGTATAEAIATHIPPGRALSLLNLYKEVAEGGDLPIATADLMAWEAACGLRSSDSLGSLAALEALEHGEPSRAMDHIRTFSGDLGRKAVELRILTRCGHLQRAQRLVEMEPSASWVLESQGRNGSPLFQKDSEDIRDQLLMALASLEYFVCASELDPDRVPAYLESVRSEVRRHMSTTQSTDHSLNDALSECDSTLVFLSQQLGCPSWTSELPYTNLSLEGRSLWQWQISQNVTAVWRGEVLLGIQRAQELRQLSRQDRAARTRSQSPRIQMVGLLLAAGEWVDAGEILDDSWTDTHKPNEFDTGNQLFVGMMSALTGLHEQALELLVPAGIQLREYDSYGLLPIALAGSALAYASLGEDEHARHQLFSLAVGPRRRSVTTSKMTRYLEAQALYRLGNHLEAIGILSEEVAMDQTRGNVSWALLELSALVALGDMDAVGRLKEMSHLANGRFAEACRQFSEAYEADDHEGVLLAADSLAHLGHLGFAQCTREMGRSLPGAEQNPARFAEGTRQTFTESGRPMGIGRPSGPTGGVGDPARGGRVGVLADLAGLTARQVDIAVLAVAGRSNRDIAQELSISVRTVESHLYQIFNKLGIHTRDDLSIVWETASE